MAEVCTEIVLMTDALYYSDVNTTRGYNLWWSLCPNKTPLTPWNFIKMGLQKLLIQSLMNCLYAFITHPGMELSEMTNATLWLRATIILQDMNISANLSFIPTQSDNATYPSRSLVSSASTAMSSTSTATSSSATASPSSSAILLTLPLLD